MNQTSIEEVKKVAATGDYKLIPVKREIFADVRTPVETLRSLQSVSEHCFLLESAGSDMQWGRYSFLGYDPKMELSCTDHVLTVIAGGKLEVETKHPGDYIRKILDENKAPLVEGFPTFTGGLVGYFSYEYMQYGEPSLKFSSENNNGFSDMDLMLFDKLICFDNYKQKIILIANVKTSCIESSFAKAQIALDEMQRLVESAASLERKKGKLLSEIRPKFSEKEYCEMVTKVKKHIYEGDIFQLVLSNPMEADFEGSLLDTYRVLRTTNPSPYMFYFSGDTEIAGASPETLVKVTGREIKTFPLAGTSKRGANFYEDQMLEKKLLSDEKEKAEHNMLVDLGRNDLGKLCDYGTVEVEKYMAVERFSHVMHIGSEIKGRLSIQYSAIDAVDSVLPAGTLSGAPKIRACQIIDELENDKRGIYGGAIGYVDFAGNLDTCIAIRLAYRKGQKVFVRSGAGIVADSVSQKEFQECVNKAGAVVEALKEASRL